MSFIWVQNFHFLSTSLVESLNIFYPLYIYDKNTVDKLHYEKILPKFTINQVSHEKNPPTFHYTGWLLGILILVYYNAHIAG